MAETGALMGGELTGPPPFRRQGSLSFVMPCDFFDVYDADMRIVKNTIIQDFLTSSTNVFEGTAPSIKGMHCGIDYHCQGITTVIGLGCYQYLHLTCSQQLDCL